MNTVVAFFLKHIFVPLKLSVSEIWSDVGVRILCHKVEKISLAAVKWLKLSVTEISSQSYIYNCW